MVFRGAYDNIGGVRRPYLTLRVRSTDGIWIPLPFLIDSGADATFLDASCLLQMGIDPTATTESLASGVGGQAAHVPLATALRFESEEGVKTFTGTIGVFVHPGSCDTPVLGRDLLDHFCLVCDRGRDLILLLSSPHDYEVVVR
ncbi:MAG: aspartyl protease family protein [Candidatus Binatia bacterium]